MSKMQELLEERFSTSDTTKVKALAKQSATGALTSFSGLFKPTELLEKERLAIETLLKEYRSSTAADIQKDLNALIAITSEVKAINNQAAILHGERIMRAQKIFKEYREGAFSSWLMATYGNRQTPYNFLLYYEFYQQLPSELRNKIETVPRQAVYVLASRQATFEQKKAMISSYSGETKREMLEIIRSRFPLPQHDKRRADEAQNILIDLEKLFLRYQKESPSFDATKTKEISQALRKFLSVVEAY